MIMIAHTIYSQTDRFTVFFNFISFIISTSLLFFCSIVFSIHDDDGEKLDRRENKKILPRVTQLENNTGDENINTGGKKNFSNKLWEAWIVINCVNSILPQNFSFLFLFLSNNSNKMLGPSSDDGSKVCPSIVCVYMCIHSQVHS